MCLCHLELSDSDWAERNSAAAFLFVSPSNEMHHIKCPQISNSIAGHKTWHLL